MPFLIAVIDKATGNCSTEVCEVASSPRKLVPLDASRQFDERTSVFIAGARRPGPYLLSETQTVSLTEALSLAGGPAICDTCYESAGESGLWNLARPAYVKRGAEHFKVRRDEWKTWILQSGDHVYFAHVPL